MSSDIRWILEAMSSGLPAARRSAVLDLGGGRGMLRQPLEQRDHWYINLDVQRYENGEPSLIGDAHRLPFEDGVFDLVISKDTLEHFAEPSIVVQEVHRVLKEDGYFLIWVPFMHPFHSDDLYRYTPLGLSHLLSAFQITLFDSPQWVFTVVGLAFIEVFKRMGIRFSEKPVKVACSWLDRRFSGQANKPKSFANAYRVVARKMEVRRA